MRCDYCEIEMDKRGKPDVIRGRTFQTYKCSRCERMGVITWLQQDPWELIWQQGGIYGAVEPWIDRNGNLRLYRF